VIPVCRKILGREPRCPEWITAIGTAIGLSGAAATAAGAAVVGAGLGLAASDITQMVQGNFPWKDPGKFFASGAKGLALGAAGGAIGGAVGPAIGSLGASGGSIGGGGGGAVGGGAGGGGGAVVGGGASGTVGGAGGAGFGGAGGMSLAEGATGASSIFQGVGENLGTIAQEAGAATPSELSGITGAAANQAIQSGGGTQGLMQESLKKIVANTVGGSVTGGLNEPRDFGRGALMGAAGGAASGAFSAGAGAVFRGQGAGIVPNSVNGPDRGFSMMGDAGGSFSRAYDPNTAASAFDGGFDNFMDTGSMGYDPGREAFSISRSNIATPPPTLAERATNFGIKQGSNFAGSAARNMVGRAMSQMPEDPMSQNPYAQYGQTPYWMRRM